MQKTLDLLKAARKLLAEHWIPFNLFDDTGGVCQLGALKKAQAFMLCPPTLRHKITIDFEDAEIVVPVRTSVQQHREALAAYREARCAIILVSRELHPELIGQVKHRSDGAGMDCFDQHPAIYINNHLGKDAILAVFDVAIARLTRQEAYAVSVGIADVEELEYA